MKARAAFVLNAATATLSLAQTLPPVTITATRTEANPFDVPASVTVIDGDAARAAGRPESNLSESIATVPGVSARERQNYAQDLQLSIRGFGARSTFGVRGVRLYVDGLQEGHIHDLTATGVRSTEGQTLLHAQAYYTLNTIPEQ